MARQSIPKAVANAAIKKQINVRREYDSTGKPMYRIYHKSTGRAEYSDNVEYIRSLKNIEVFNVDRFGAKNYELSTPNTKGHCDNTCKLLGCHG